MSMKLFRRWFRSAQPTPKQYRKRRVMVEALEDRLCPSRSGILISLQPIGQTVAINGQATLKAAAVGNPTPTVQWQVSTDNGSTFTDITGATQDNLVFTAPATPGVDFVRAVFSNSVGSIDTRAVPITIDVPPTVTTNPVSQEIDTGNTVTFTAAAMGTPTPSVVWQVSHNQGATFNNIPFADLDTFTFATKNGQNGDEFRALFKNPVGQAFTTAATLTVDFAPAVTTQPVSQTVDTGSSVTLTAAASGSPTPTIAWEVSTDHGLTYTVIPGATADTYTFTASSTPSSALYRAQFTNTLGTATSRAASVTAGTPPTVTIQPSSQTVNAGNPVTFTAAASGTPAPHVQWQISSDGGVSFHNIPLATTDTLTFTARAYQNGDEIHAIFFNGVGSVSTTDVTLTVDYLVQPPPPNTQTVATGSQVTLTATASGNPTPTVQWQISTDHGKTFTDIPGATSFTYVFTAPSTPGVEWFQAVFTNPIGTTTSPLFTVIVDAPPVVTTNPVSETVNAGGTATFTAAATGTPAPHVQWQISRDGGTTYHNIPLATTDTLTFTAWAYQNGDEVRGVFTNGGGQAFTTAALLTVDFGPRITTQPLNQTVAVSSQVTLSAAANANPTPTVAWEVSTDGGHNYTFITGATSDTYTFTAPATPGVAYYRAVFTNSTGTNVTRAARVMAELAPTVTSNPLSQTVNTGDTVTFTAAGTSANRVQWQVSHDQGATFSNIPFADTDTLTFAAKSGENGDEFRAVFTNAVGQAFTSAATLTVDFGPRVTLQPVNEKVQVGSQVTLTAAASGSPTPNVQWKVSTDGGATYTTIPGANADTYTFTASATPGVAFYKAVFTNALGTVTSRAARVKVVAPVV
jgi:hypothetical protein